MIQVDIRPAKRRFSNRKQWKFSITAANGEPIDPRDTYANVGDICTMLHTLLIEDEVQVRIHYDTGIEVVHLRPPAPRDEEAVQE